MGKGIANQQGTILDKIVTTELIMKMTEQKFTKVSE